MSELLIMGDDPRELLEYPAERIGLDTETTGLTWDDRIIGVSLAWPGPDGYKSCYLLDPAGTSQLPMFGVAGTMQVEQLLDIIFGSQIVAMANHSFDYRFMFKHMGCPPLPNVVDVQHMARHFGVQQGGLSLVALYSKYVGKVKGEVAALKANRANLSRMNAETVASYAREDAIMTLAVYDALRTNPGVSLYRPYHMHDQKFMTLVMELTARGVPLDMEHIHGRITSYRQRMMELQKNLIKYGIRNANSTVDINAYCTANNIPAENTGAEELEKFESDYPALAMVNEFKSLDKAIGSWLEPAYENGLWNGHLHSQLNPFGTKSYRMSAGDPNAQGFPMEVRGNRAFGSMFGIFKSLDPDYELWGFDLKQAEMRLAAVLSGDVDMQFAIAQGGDPYKALAKLIWDDEGKRQTAKSALLSAIYEVGVKKFALACGITQAESKNILSQTRSRFPKAMQTSKNLARMMESTKKVDLVTGRPRWMTQAEIDEEQFYKAFNQRVQGSLAELVDEAMLQTEEVIPNRMVLQIHDSIVLLISKDPKKKEEEFATVASCMQNAVKKVLHGQAQLPFPIDPKPFQVIEDTK